jgi:hypothetical protein
MPLAVPMVWQEQKHHFTVCYFCLTKISGIFLKSKHSIQYPSLPSAVRPVLHSQDLPVPKPPEKWTIDDDNNEDEPVHMEQDINYPDFQPSTSNEPHIISQGELNDSARDLNLSKSQAEFLGSRLQGWNLLQKNTNISIFCYRQKYIAQYFASAGDLVYCTDIDKVMAALGQDHKTDEW